MPKTPEFAKATADNRGQRASDKRGRDTIGTGGSVVPSESRTKVTMASGPIVQSDKPIGFDGRSNTAWGAPKEQPYSAENGARLVGDTKLTVKAPQATTAHDKFVGNIKGASDGRPGAQRFRIEDGNHAKRSNRE